MTPPSPAASLLPLVAAALLAACGGPPPTPTPRGDNASPTPTVTMGPEATSAPTDGATPAPGMPTAGTTPAPEGPTDGATPTGEPGATPSPPQGSPPASCQGGAPASAYYPDSDGDGFGDGAYPPTWACALQAGLIDNAQDCDDQDPQVHPGDGRPDASCDGRDDDCDGEADEDFDTEATCTCDGFTSFLLCEGGALFCPAMDLASEERDGQDDDCDGLIDEDWDRDHDGYLIPQGGEGATPAAGDDCDDEDPAVHPGAPTSCNGRDDDCDGLGDAAEGFDADGDGHLSAALCEGGDDCDDQDPALNPSTAWYLDEDGDGHGVGQPLLTQCQRPSVAFAPRPGDCDDADPGVHPGAAERPGDGRDQDCDGGDLCYVDADLDGYHGGATRSSADLSCDDPGEALASQGGDCDDADPSVHPGAADVPIDGVDQDCDGADSPPIDLNLDGYPDLIQVNGGGGRAVDSNIFYGGPDGLDPEDRDDLPTLGAHDGCVADFDRDGWLDVAFANISDGASNQVPSYLYWGSPAGFFPGERLELPTLGAHGCLAEDLNGDGWVDLAFANGRNGATVNVPSYVYWNVDGVFSLADRDELPTHQAVGLAAADLNQDGWLDLVFADYFNDTSYRADSFIYWGGAGGFNAEEPCPLPTLGAQGDPVIGDLNQDGFLDVLLTNAYDDHTHNVDSYVYFGPTFAVGDRLELPGHGTQAGAIVDVDGDGHRDVVLAGFYDGASYDAESYVYFGSQRGWSANDRVGLPSRASQELLVEDLDSDGLPELIFTSAHRPYGPTLQSLYWGSPTGPHAEDVERLDTHDQEAVTAAVGDLDRDGHPELIFGGYNDGDYQTTTTRVFQGSARGPAHSARTPIPTQGAQDVLIEDLNADGWQDLVIVNHYTGSSYSLNSLVLWGDARGAGRGERQELPTLACTQVCSGDFNKDGHRDLVFANRADGASNDIDSYLYWGGDGGYSPERRLGLPTTNARGCAVADLDGDGDDDVVFANNYSDAAHSNKIDSYVYLNDGQATPGFRRVGLPTHGAHAVTAQDLDGDGVMEILFSNYNDGHTYNMNSFLYWGSDEGWSPEDPTLLTSYGAWKPIAVGDLNGDGYPDLVVPSHYDGDNRVDSWVYFGSATGYSNEDRRAFPLDRTSSALVADLDGDGYDDVLFLTYSDGDYTVNHHLFYGGPGGPTPELVLELPGPGAQAGAVEDLNGDGFLDVIIAGYYDGSNASASIIWWGDELGFTPERRTTLTNTAALDVAAGDLDGDGRPDLAFANYNDGDYQATSYIYWASERCAPDQWDQCFAEERAGALPAAGTTRVIVVGDARGEPIPGWPLDPEDLGGGALKVYYADRDGDGYGLTGDSQPLLYPQPPYSARTAGDCDDADATSHPDGSERCEGRDNDCDGQTDEGVTTRYYQDSDGDTWGISGSYRDQCGPSAPFTTTRPGDCYDQSSQARPDQGAYFTGHRGDGSFDYNCNGAQEVADGRVAWAAPAEEVLMGIPPGLFICWNSTPGWYPSSPGCGQSGIWLACTVGLPVPGEPRTQTCR